MRDEKTSMRGQADRPTQQLFPGALGANHLVHACVVCSDFDRSFAFYTGVLGAAPVTPPFDLDVGDSLGNFLGFSGNSKCKVVFLRWGEDASFIELQQYYDPGTRIARTTKDMGLARFALRVDRIEAALDWVRAQNIEIVGGAGAWEFTLPSGLRRRGFSVRDPDGTLVELIEYGEYSGPT